MGNLVLTTKDLRVTRPDGSKEVYHVIKTVKPSKLGNKFKCRLGNNYKDEYVLVASLGEGFVKKIQLLSIHKKGKKTYIGPVSERKTFGFCAKDQIVLCKDPIPSCWQGFSFNYRGPKEMTLVAIQPDKAMLSDLATAANEASSFEFVNVKW